MPRRRRGARAPTARAAAAPDAPSLGPRIDDETYEHYTQEYGEASRKYGITLSAEQLARPLQAASAAQRELLAEVFAANPRFKVLHDTVHLAEAMTKTANSEQLLKGLQLRGGLYSVISEFYNSDAWLAAADSRQDSEAPLSRAARVGDCTFCPGVAAQVLLTHDDGDCCYSCLVPTTRAYMRRTTDKPIPLCCAECPGAPWELEEIEEEEEEDERGIMVHYAELVERSYSACDCCMERDSETVTVRRMPTCGSCGVVLRDARKHCAVCQRVYYCSKECQRADWKAHKPSCEPYIK
jgi:hypothetical protein